jgi:hypothetical protein
MSSATLPCAREEACPPVRSRGWLLPGVAVLLLAAQISPYWYPTPDSTAYLSIARNLARNQVLQNLGSEQLYYFPGYSLLISPIFLLSDEPFLLICVLHFFLSLLLMLGIWLWARPHVPEAAGWVLLLSVVNLSFCEAYRRALSEVAFMTVLVWLVLLLNRIREATSSARRVFLPALLASLLMIYLAMIRPAGIMVAAGFGTMLLLAAWRGQLSWSRAVTLTLAVGVPATLVLGALILHDRALAASSGTTTYTEQLRDPTMGAFAQVMEGVRLRIYELGRMMYPGMYKSYARSGEWLNVNSVLYLPLALVVFVGWCRFVRQREDCLAWAFPFYLALHVLWPFDQATRFFTPLMPLFLVCLWFALGAWQHRLRLFGGLAVAPAAVALGCWCFDGIPRARATEGCWVPVRQMAHLIEKEPAPVQVSESLGDTALQFQYTLDRPMAPYRPGTTARAGTVWLVISRHEQAAPGFVVHMRIGDYQLCHRCRATTYIKPAVPGGFLVRTTRRTCSPRQQRLGPSPAQAGKRIRGDELEELCRAFNALLDRSCSLRFSAPARRVATESRAWAWGCRSRNAWPIDHALRRITCTERAETRFAATNWSAAPTGRGGCERRSHRRPGGGSLESDLLALCRSPNRPDEGYSE